MKKAMLDVCKKAAFKYLWNFLQKTSASAFLTPNAGLLLADNGLSWQSMK